MILDEKTFTFTPETQEEWDKLDILRNLRMINQNRRLMGLKLQPIEMLDCAETFRFFVEAMPGLRERLRINLLPFYDEDCGEDAPNHAEREAQVKAGFQALVNEPGFRPAVMEAVRQAYHSEQSGTENKEAGH